jgi:uncharacterized membrane-anchored protein
MQKLLMIAGLVLALGLAHWTIAARERLLAEGSLIFLELAPVDPRSLMQGDYMALRFKVAQSLRAAVRDPPPQGAMIVAIDADRVATFKRIEQADAPPAADELRLNYKIRRNDVRVATNAFFFREGTADQYRTARYGAFRVDSAGSALLVSLHDKDRNLLGVAR